MAMHVQNMRHMRFPRLSPDLGHAAAHKVRAATTRRAEADAQAPALHLGQRGHDSPCSLAMQAASASATAFYAPLESILQ